MLNGAGLNARRFNIGVRPIPEDLAGDAVGEVSASESFIRVRHFDADAPVVASSYISLSARRYLVGDVYTTQLSGMAPSAVRVGSGSAIAEIAGSLYYTRVIYWSGAGAIEVIAISDVGVVYGEGSGVMFSDMGIAGTRVRPGFGDAIAVVKGGLSAAAIRRVATANGSGISALFARLDSAHITGGGIRHIDGFGDAYAILDIVDAGMKRQVFIGGADLLMTAFGSGSAVRNAVGAAEIKGLLSGRFTSMRRAEGAGVAVLSGSLAGEILVPFEASAVMRLQASMTGYVYRRTATMDALVSMIVELDAKRKKTGFSDALVVGVVELDAKRRRMATGTSTINLNAESTASDFNFVGLDDADEIFARPAMQREFARPATIREWRRS